MRTTLPAVLALSAGIASASSPLVKRQDASSSSSNPYVPKTTSCPSNGSLIRSADSLNSDEETYISSRSPIAADALSSWLSQALPDLSLSSDELPRLALALSGGGAKAGMTSAGAVYGLDGREDSESPVKGLLQSMTYISALSGGSLTLSGVMANDFAQISTLRERLLDASYQNAFSAVIENLDAVRAAVGNRTAAGYPATLVDIYGQVISYNYITSTGGANLTWSNVTSQSSFQNHSAPFPIITITQANVPEGICEPSMDSAIWEVSPVEFGSFDEKVAAFYPTQYMGTTGDGDDGQCIIGYDNTGYVTAISSNILLPDDNECYTGNFTVDQLNDTLAETINTAVSGVSLVNPYGIIPNPFYQSSSAGSAISSQENIFGTDGGYSGQGIPIFPWLQPFRAIDIIFVIDAATQPPSNITNGTSISNTYTSAQAKGLTRMPLVPTPEQVVSQNLSSRAQFYGCHNTSVATVVYLPNSELGDIPSAFSFTEEEVDAAIEGGTAMVTQSQDGQDAGEWAACLACVIVHKNVTDLPEVCTGCLERYCWPREGGEEDGADGGSGGEEPSATTTGAGGGASETAAAGAGNVIRGSAGLLVVCAVATLAMLM